MQFLTDYLEYNSGNECPTNYHRWCALFILAATLGKRVYCTQSIDEAYYKVYPNLYIGLIGKQGSRKSSAKDIARDMFIEANPDSPMAASVQSCQDIVKTLSMDEAIRCYTDEQGQLIECRPYTFFINELKNFLSINPSQMLDFLTDIYDRSHFDSSTIKHGLQAIENPCINFLCCETPKWIIDKLKYNIISGGFSRRIVYVYELDKRQRISFPNVTNTMRQARQRCVAHLRSISKLCGRFTWTTDARVYYDKWYQGMVVPADEVMEGYYESKHIQMLKVAMGIACAAAQPKLEFTVDIFKAAIAILDVTEINMPKLSVAAGRNELAVPQQNIIELIEKNGGIMAEREVERLTSKDLSPSEQYAVLGFLKKTRQVYYGKAKLNGVEKTMIMTERHYAKGVADGTIKEIQN